MVNLAVQKALEKAENILAQERQQNELEIAELNKQYQE